MYKLYYLKMLDQLYWTDYELILWLTMGTICISYLSIKCNLTNIFSTGEQEQQSSGSIGKGKYRTLKDLFKPPLDIIHKGTFETVSTIL